MPRATHVLAARRGAVAPGTVKSLGGSSCTGTGPALPWRLCLRCDALQDVPADGPGPVRCFWNLSKTGSCSPGLHPLRFPSRRLPRSPGPTRSPVATGDLRPAPVARAVAAMAVRRATPKARRSRRRRGANRHQRPLRTRRAKGEAVRRADRRLRRTIRRPATLAVRQPTTRPHTPRPRRNTGSPWGSRPILRLCTALQLPRLPRRDRARRINYKPRAARSGPGTCRRNSQ
jgi:hypothetical protein